MILVTGGSGQLARWLGHLQPDNIRTVPRAELDITDRDAVLGLFDELGPAVVINAAAHTAVDKAEEEPELAAAINRDGASHVAEGAQRAGARLLHVSTDYVFGESGLLDEPLEVDHPTRPRSVYGTTKLEGEHAVRRACPDATIVRTAWVYTGPGRARLGLAGDDFVTTMTRLGETHDTVTVVDDQMGSPTFARDLAAGLLEAVDNDAARGRTLHAAGAGRATWCDLARAVFEENGADPDRVRPCTTEEFPRPAPRPAYSVLSSGEWERFGLSPLRDWRDAVTAAMTWAR
ncbi:dTDP-4-dehydrorhamnose reductase [Dietzia sp. B19]|uniref:dTDP-4-dehydrorhamnose reductase n=1 Tax=Dietzia sp. B19 TaxID=1630632 RepID=UPI00321FDE17